MLTRFVALLAVLTLAACGTWTQPSGWAEALAHEANTQASAAELQDLMDELHETAGQHPEGNEAVSALNRDTYQQLTRWHEDHGQNVEAQIECMIQRIEDHGETIRTAGDTCHQEWRARFK